jgi:DNA topoisomerase-1
MTDEAGENIIDARDAAESAGLVYVDDQSVGLSVARAARAGVTAMRPARRSAKRR